MGTAIRIHLTGTALRTADGAAACTSTGDRREGGAMRRVTRIALVSAAWLLSLLPLTAGEAYDHRHTEDFSSGRYCDKLNTTALWDSAAAELKLYPLELSIEGNCSTPDLVRHVVVEGNYAYLAGWNSGLRVIDVSDPTNPTAAGFCDTPGLAGKAAVSGNYAYVADYTNGLQVIDISVPASPWIAGIFDTPGLALGVAVEGDHVFVADYSSGIFVLDISDPTNPTYAGAYDTPGYAEDVEIDGDYAFVADNTNGLLVLDVSDPASPYQVGHYDTPSYAYGVTVSGDLAYVADYTSGLIVIDISDPANPAYAGSYNTPGTSWDVQISGDLAYVSDGSSGLQVIDVGDPSSPGLAGSIDTPDWLYCSFIAGEYAFAADRNSGLQVIEIRNLMVPTLAGNCTPPGSVWDVTVSGDHAFAADPYDGKVTVLDVTDPTSPFVATNFYDGLGQTNAVAVAGNRAFVADSDSGLVVLDVTNPAAPARIATCGATSCALDVSLSGDYAYVADKNGGMRIIDISDPANPSLAATTTFSDYAWGLTVSGDYAYVAEGSVGLQTVDITDPEAPVTSGLWHSSTYGTARDAVIEGDRAYVAGSNYCLEVIDVSSPTSPSYVTYHSTPPSNARKVAVSGDFAFVADDQGIEVADISDPAAPAAAGLCETGAYGVALAGEFMFAGAGFNGFKVFKVFQHDYDQERSRGRSSALNDLDEEIIRVKLASAHVDSIAFEVSADSGQNWQEIPPDGAEHELASPGRDLMWRTSHSYIYGLPNPACTSLDIKWFYRFALIDSIVDVPDDQGGWVRVHFWQSGLDFASEGGYPISLYGVYRRVDDLATADLVRRAGKDIDGAKTLGCAAPLGAVRIPPVLGGTAVTELDGRFFIEPRSLGASSSPPGTWEVIGIIPAHQEENYIYLAPTLADSSGTPDHSVYCISAETTTPSVYYFSPPDSGFSADNIPPGVPDGFTVAYNTGGGNQLDWNVCPDDDFQYFRVYRGESEEFVPAPAGLVHATAEPHWLDSVGEGWRYHYKITAVDHAGNESGAAPPEYVTGTEAAEVPKAFALHQNVPNPFNPTTSIIFDLPVGSYVLLAVYNADGRLVRKLVEGEMAAGRQEIRWDGRDSRGGMSASGIYFARLVTPRFSQARKMILVR